MADEKQQVEAVDRPKLEAGMLLLVPEEDPKGPAIYAAIGSKVLVAAYREFSAKVTLHEPVVPDGWTILDGPALAQYLLVNPGALAAATRKALEPADV